MRTKLFVLVGLSMVVLASVFFAGNVLAMTQADYTATFGSLDPSFFGPNHAPVSTWQSGASMRGEGMKFIWDSMQVGDSKAAVLYRVNEVFPNEATIQGMNGIGQWQTANSPNLWVWRQVALDYIARGGRFNGDNGFQRPTDQQYGPQTAQSLTGKDVFDMTCGGTNCLKSSVTPPPTTILTTPPAGTSVSQTQDLNNMISTLNTLIQKYNNLVITSGTGTTINPVTTNTGTDIGPIAAYIAAMNKDTTTANTGTTVTSFPSIITVTATNLNVRSAPSTSASLAGSNTLHAGDQFVAVESVTGDNVEGESLWWKSSKGNYVWSGGTIRSSSVN